MRSVVGLTQPRRPVVGGRRTHAVELGNVSIAGSLLQGCAADRGAAMEVREASSRSLSASRSLLLATTGAELLLALPHIIIIIIITVPRVPNPLAGEAASVRSSAAY